RRSLPGHRAVLAGRHARLVGAGSAVSEDEAQPRPGGRTNPEEGTSASLPSGLLWTGVGAVALAAVVAGGAIAQAPAVKIGLLATLEGPFAAGGPDGMRGGGVAGE